MTFGSQAAAAGTEEGGSRGNGGTRGGRGGGSQASAGRGDGGGRRSGVFWMAREDRVEQKKLPAMRRKEGSRRTRHRHARNVEETEKPGKRKKREKNAKKRMTTSVLAGHVKSEMAPSFNNPD
jgi:hypothetical protein